MNARDENENNNTGFGVIRIQVASKSARAPLAGSDRYRYQYSCTGTGTIMIDSLHPLLLSLRCWVTCHCPALDSLLGFFYSEDGVVSHLQGFPTFRVLASTRVPKYICRHKAEVSKRQYSSKAKNCNVHYFMSQWYSTVYLYAKTHGC